MSFKKKVLVLMPVHCAPKIALMTLGTWLEACDGSYEADVIIGVHENYHHYHNGLDSLMHLPVRMTKVPEIEWACTSKESAIARYSEMHARNLKEMLFHASYVGFDYLVILDHDLVFKTDFVGWAKDQDADLVGCYMQDRMHAIHVDTVLGNLMFAPKFSVWHMGMSSRFFQKVRANLELISPLVENGWFYDTFSRVIIQNRSEWNLPVLETGCFEMDKMVQHLWSMSFNFGQHQNGDEEYWKRVLAREKAFDERFPKGIGHLFGKVGL
jgi:hypothetical protein